MYLSSDSKKPLYSFTKCRKKQPNWQRSHSHRLKSSHSVPDDLYLRPANPPTTQRPAPPPWRMPCSPAEDPSPLWDSRQWQSWVSGQVRANSHKPWPPPPTSRPTPCSTAVQDISGDASLETTVKYVTLITVCKHTEPEEISGNDGEEEETVLRVATATSDGRGSCWTLIRIGGYEVLESRRLCHSQGDCSTTTPLHTQLNKSYFKVFSGCSASNASSPHQISSWSHKKCARKWSQYVLLCADLVTPKQGQGQQKWYKIVEVNGPYMHGRNEQIW